MCCNNVMYVFLVSFWYARCEARRFFMILLLLLLLPVAALDTEWTAALSRPLRRGLHLAAPLPAWRTRQWVAVGALEASVLPR